MINKKKDISNNIGTGFETLDLDLLLILNRIDQSNDIEKRLTKLEAKFDLLEKLL